MVENFKLWGKGFRPSQKHACFKCCEMQENVNEVCEKALSLYSFFLDTNLIIY